MSDTSILILYLIVFIGVVIFFLFKMMDYDSINEVISDITDGFNCYKIKRSTKKVIKNNAYMVKYVKKMITIMQKENGINAINSINDVIHGDIS